MSEYWDEETLEALDKTKKRIPKIAYLCDDCKKMIGFFFKKPSNCPYCHSRKVSAYSKIHG